MTKPSRKYLAHRRRMLKLAKQLTEDQVDCVAYVLRGEKITENPDVRFRQFDIVQWHKDAVADLTKKV